MSTKPASKTYSTIIKFIMIFLFFGLSSFDCSMNPQLDETIDDTQAPTVPQNLSTGFIQAHRFPLSWDASTDDNLVVGYRIYRNDVHINDSHSTVYADTSVAANTYYSYQVSAYDAAGKESNLSDPVTGTTPDKISGSQMIIDHNSTDIEAIPEEYIEVAKANLHIAYQQTSHGSQILTGMEALMAYSSYGTLYQFSDNGNVGLYFDTQVNGRPISETAQDLTYDAIQGSGYTLWADATRAFLNSSANNHINVIMWAWCNIAGHDITRYLTNMEQLISEYGFGGTNPRAATNPVEFIFMTGHSNADGETGSAATAAAQIRQHCIANNRWLIDYYDLECYDPDGNYFGDNYVGDNLRYSTDGGSTWTGNWAVDYLTAYPTSDLYNLAMGPGCAYCNHSDADDGHKESKLNCILKGRAAWWLFAGLAGWSGN